MKTVLIILACLIVLIVLGALALVRLFIAFLNEGEDSAAELEVFTSDGRLREEVFTSK